MSDVSEPPAPSADPVSLLQRRYAAVPFDNFPSLHFALGTKSADDRAILGQDGHVFLYQGTNKILDLYAMQPPAVKVFATAWEKVLRARVAELEKRGIRHFSFIIPEKSTVMPEKYPLRISPPSPVYAHLDSALSDAHIVPLLHFFQHHPDRLLLFPKTDSHLSVLGCLVLFRRLMATSFPDAGAAVTAALADPALISDEKVIRAGPLAGMLFNVPVYEEFLKLRADAFAAFGEGDTIEEFDPGPDKHVGTRRVWRNTKAPIPLRVVAFGNSFCERGANAQGLSWWFRRFFAEFHFLWQSHVDYDYLDRVKPDCVVFQSIERFQTVVPAS